MSEEVYLRLREFFDRLPGGFPATESGVELKILKRYFTPEEAEMVMNLKPFPEPVSAIAERAGLCEEETAEKLEHLARRGCIFRVRLDDQVLYMAMSYLVGIYEFHIKDMDRELAQLMHEYAPHLGEAWGKMKNKQNRVVPVESAVESVPSVADYDQIREMVKKQQDIAVADCICRVEMGLLGHPCERPLETCLEFGYAATYYIENGIGRRISVEECLEILDRAEEAGLVLYPSNTRELTNICCCCSCCCNELRNLRTYERPADHVLASFQARIDPALCAACGTCLERCQIEAIKENPDYMEVDLGRCIGCGLCVSTCPNEAISMIPKENVPAPPANVLEMFGKLLEERGIASG
jgi:Pyruvate/2-oxoacid:ferredoxin oxidoreductase delta subunit/DNA-binding Lrp family transcriptional regulator